MTHQPATISNNQRILPQLPAWVTAGHAETLEIVAFRSGAALTVLDQLVCAPGHGVPVKLLANRLALGAATATSKLEGRLAREVDLRDAYHLTGLCQVVDVRLSLLSQPDIRRSTRLNSRPTARTRRTWHGGRILRTDGDVSGGTDWWSDHVRTGTSAPGAGI